jgi:hypothetical protein
MQLKKINYFVYTKAILVVMPLYSTGWFTYGFTTLYELMSVLMMEAESTSVTSVNLYQTTRCYIPEDSHLRTRRRENLKCHIRLVFSLR